MPDVSGSDLSGVAIFASLDDEQLAEVASWFERQEVSPDIVVVGEGAAGYGFFVIESGGALVTAGGREIASLGPGDFFGEFALIGEGRRQATVTTTSPTTLLTLFGTDFRQLQQAHPDIAAQIEATMRERAAELA